MEVADSIWQNLDPEKRKALAALGVTNIDIPNINQAKMFLVLTVLNFYVTERAVKYAFLRREIVPVRLGQSNFVSFRDIINWVESRRQPGIYHAPENNAAAAVGE